MKASEKTTSVIPFTFKAVKDLAKPGSWRRGYGYYRTPGQVLSVVPEEQGVHGRVKGNYKDAYEIHLAFQPSGVSAACDCPLEEEWCKHAVSVALTAIKAGLYQAFWKLPIDPLETETCTPLTEVRAADFEGTYRVLAAWEVKPRNISVQVWNRRDGSQVKQIEPILRAAVALHQAGEMELNPEEQRELKLLEWLYREADADTGTGWFHINQNKQEDLLAQLSRLEEVCQANTQGRIRFETEPLRLVLSVNASMVGNVLIALHWHRPGDPPDVYPLDEITLFGREVGWGFYRNRMFPLSTKLKNLPGYLTRSAFYDIRDADGGKFLFEELPKLRQFVEVEQAEVIDKATLAQEPPKRILSLRMVDETTLRGELEFSYDETRIPFSKVQEAPYVTVTDAERDMIYWLKRDPKLENRAFQTLQKTRLQPLQSNHFQAEGDDIIDFYNLDRPQLEAEGWVIETKEDLSFMRTAPDPLRIVGRLDFGAEDSVDQFTLSIACAVGTEHVDLDTVQSHFVQGKKYFLLPDQGYVEVPLAAILQFTKTLNVFDKEEVDQDCYRIKTFQAGLISELMEQGVDLEMTPRFRKFWDMVTAFSTLEDVSIPEGVNADLRPYQKHGFNWLWFLYSYGLNGILADDMGLGKTLQTLVLLKKAADEDSHKASLIVCPTSLVYNWRKEAEKFTPDLKVLVLTGSERHHQLKAIHDADIVLTSYALVRRDVKILRQFPFRYVILDESQNIKNPESQTAQAVKQLTCQHRLALSGTPIENRLSEIWSVFDFLMPGFLLDLEEFRYRYITPIEERGNRDAERRLKKQMAPFILRRLKRDVAKDLPDKIENVLYCDMLPEQQDLYLEVLERTREEVFAKYNAKGQAVSQASILSALLRLRQVCCHPKLLKEFIAHEGVGSGKFEAMQEMLEGIISEGHRILLFSQFVEMLDIVKGWLETKGIRHEYLTGDTRDREERVERFNRDDSIPIFLISLKAGGTGLNLTGADYVIHYDPWWNPAVEEQATDRAHRIGQTKKVFVYRMITRGTVEEKIMQLKERKRDLVDTVLSVDRDFAKKMTFEDLKDILTPDF